MRGFITTVCGVFGAGVLIAGTAAPTGYHITNEALPSQAQQQQQPPPPPPPTQQQQEVLLNTVGKAGTGPKLGMQAFTGPAEAARVVAEVLWNDLDYEREYHMISRKATAGIPAATAPTSLPFATWKEAGADYVMMGAVQDTAGKLAVEIRIVRVGGVEPGAVKFAQRYDGCASANLRYCAHHIADDIHKKEMNLDGVARTRVAFTSDRAGERLTGRPMQDATVGKEIYLMDYDGARQTRVTSSRSLNIAPTGGTTAPKPGTIPPSPAEYYNTAYNYYYENQFEMAVKVLGDAISRFPESTEAPRAQNTIGDAYYRMGRFKEALMAHTAVITNYKDPDAVSDAYYKQGMDYEALKQIEAARKSYTQVVSLFPNSSAAVQAQQALRRIGK